MQIWDITAKFGKTLWCNELGLNTLWKDVKKIKTKN